VCGQTAGVNEDEHRRQHAQWLARAAAVPLARLATTSARTGAIDLVPVTFAIVDGCFVTAVDHKPKSTRELARLANIRASGTATVLVDEWHDDWSQLWWVRMRGDAREVADMGLPVAVAAIDALVAKYAQYREYRPEGPLLVVTPTDIRSWSAAGD